MTNNIMKQMDELGLTDIGEFEKMMAMQAAMKYTERWMPVLGYEELYEVSDYGRVRNKEGKILKPQLYGGQREYRAVGLSRNSKQKTTGIHRLVAECFVGLPTDTNPDGTPMLTSPEVNHIDGDTANNHYTNLEWCDRYYNNSHRVGSEDWNYTHRTKKDGRAKTLHSPKFCKSRIELFENKIANLKHQNELLLQGIHPDTMLHTHRPAFLQKKVDSNCELMLHYQSKIDHYQKLLDEAIERENTPKVKKKCGTTVTGKPIIATTPDGTEVEYASVKEFANAMGVIKATVYQCLAGKAKTVKKHTIRWK